MKNISGLPRTTLLPLPEAVLKGVIPDEHPWRSLAFSLMLVYPFLVMVFRHRRIKAVQSRYGYRSRDSMVKMTDSEAHEILIVMSDFEFPSMYEKGLQFALFRTYGIPSISSLLVKTSQLSTTKNVGKRYADTAALLVEMYGNAPTDPRNREAFARLNYLHGHYIRQGKISNDDLLYTLALFMVEPCRMIAKTEWRQLTDLETCAMGVFHKSMGDAMEISYNVLPSSNAGFKDGLQFYAELEAWSVAYETEYMVPHKDNYDTAIETQRLLLSNMAPAIRPTIAKVLSAAMDDRLRAAIMFDVAPPIYTQLLNGFLTVRKYFLRYLALPRPTFMRDRLMSDEVDGEGRRHFTRYDTLPFYVKPTFWNRYGPGAWGSRLMGIPLPGDEGMAPEGYSVTDIGPHTFTGKGYAEVSKTKEKLLRERTGGCPFMVR